MHDPSDHLLFIITFPSVFRRSDGPDCDAYLWAAKVKNAALPGEQPQIYVPPAVKSDLDDHEVFVDQVAITIARRSHDLSRCVPERVEAGTRPPEHVLIENL